MQKNRQIPKRNIGTFAQENFPELEKKGKLFVMPGMEHLVGVDLSSPALDMEAKQKAEQEVFERVEAEINAYNDGIRNFDPLYADIVPVRGILIRLQRIAMENSGGIISAPMVEVVIGTQAGNFFKERRTAEYQFRRVGVVVAVNPALASTFTPGMIVQVNDDVIIPRKPTEGHAEMLPFSFVHYSANTSPGQPPKACTDRHHGYFLIKDPMTHVECILAKSEGEKVNVQVEQ